MVIERPPISDSRMELESLEEATPLKAKPRGATPIKDVRAYDGRGPSTISYKKTRAKT